jgi:D-3-phosphoglycerate dehydrogenase
MKDIKSCRLLVTPTSFGKGDPALRSELEAQVGEVIYNPFGRPLASAELVNLLPGCDGYIAGLDTIDRAAIAAADCLKVIVRYGVGVDNVDLPAAWEKGIIVSNTPGANSVSVAELTITLMLSLARNMIEACAATRRGEWPRLSGLTLEGKCIGLLGLGAIGKQVARRLAGFDCRVLAYDPYPDRAFANQYGIELLPMEEILPQADFVSLHLPLLPETKDLVNQRFIARMKRGAVLINTSRGEVLNESALVEALKSGQLRGAALDAFAEEPPGTGNPLLSLPQVIVTPHTGAHTDGATLRMGRMSVEGCLAVLRGEQPRYPVTSI